MGREIIVRRSFFKIIVLNVTLILKIFKNVQFHVTFQFHVVGGCMTVWLLIRLLAFLFLTKWLILKAKDMMSIAVSTTFLSYYFVAEFLESLGMGLDFQRTHPSPINSV